MGSLEDIVDTSGSYAKGVSMNFTSEKKKKRETYKKKIRVIEKYRPCSYLEF